MARPTKTERQATVHAEALRRFGDIQAAVQDERLQCLEDRRFATIAGAMWDGPLGDQFENRPKIEVNKVHLAVLRIINEYRNNRITVDFIEKDGSTSDLAEVCDGLYRADEQDSSAEEAYDNAFDEAVTGGFGAFRLRNVYEDDEDDDNDHQRIKIEPIFDADTTVFFDLNARKQDKSDANFAFYLIPMTVQAYKAEYGDDPATWPKGLETGRFDWVRGDTVYLAEYYSVESVRDTVRTYTTIDGKEERYRDADFEANENLDAELAAVGTTLTKTKRTTRRRVRKYLMSGGGILEDHGFIAGKHIPIIPVYGKRWYIDGIERFCGHVRLAKDAQRLKNMQLSRLAEISAYSTIEKPIFTPEQVAGHELRWARDGVDNYPFMLVNPVTDLNGNEVPQGPVGYTKPPSIPPAMAALLQVTEQDISDILGNQQAGEELQPQMSGKAVELVQNRLDMQAFIYMSNMAKAVRRAGEVWLSMASEIYVEEDRPMKSIGVQGNADQVVLNKPTVDAKTGETIYDADLSKAKLDVAVDVGPSSSSKRAATVRALTGMLQLAPDPQTQTVLTAAALMNMEGEGLSSIRDYFRKKLVEMGVEEPTEEEKADMMAAAQNAQPNTQDQLAAAMAMEAQAKAVRAQAETEKAVAQTQGIKADTIETLAGIDTSRQTAAIQAAEKIAGLIQPPQPPSGVMNG